jgi:choline-sulfatase
VRAIYDLARVRDGRPFLLVASFSHPHDPWEMPAEYWDRYKDVTIDGPRVPAMPDAELDPHSRRIREMCAGSGLEVPDEVIQNARRAHYAAVSYIDDKVGQLLDALETVGLRDDTVVIFTADHGEMLGERGLWYKMSFFEDSAGIPLIVSAPGKFRPRRVSANVSLLDMVPTLAELCGAGLTTGADKLDGASLVPLLSGDRDARTDTVVGEYLAEGALAPVVMIRRTSLKFVSSPADPDHLFYLAAHPAELTHLPDETKRADEIVAFKEEMARRWDLGVLRNEVVDSQRRRRLIARALSVGSPASWDFEPDQDSTQRYVRGYDFWSPFKRARLRRRDTPPQKPLSD